MTHMYIELSGNGANIETSFCEESEQELLALLKKYFKGIFEPDPELDDAETVKRSNLILADIDRAGDLASLGKAVDFTFGWGENDMKVGHCFVLDKVGRTDLW
jgi:hypothetical protein